MKNKIILLAALVCMLNFYGQQKIAGKVQELVSQNTQFRHFALFTPESTPAHIEKNVVENAVYAAIDSRAANEIAQFKYNTIELEIPYGNNAITVQLYKVDVLAEGFHVDATDKTDIPYTAGAYYRGIIKGDAHSVASFNFFHGEMNGIVSGEGINNLVIGRLKKEKGNAPKYIIYSDANLKIPNTFTCSTEEPDADALDNHNHQGRGVASNNCVTMYFEIDNDIYVQNGSNFGATTNWMTSVFNNVQTLYDNDGITTAIKSVFVWNIPDPYYGQSSGDYLMQFYEQTPIFDGDLGQLVGIDPGGLGGVAVGIGGICSDYKFSYSDVDIYFDSVPLFSWTVQVIAHELGHLMGSPHTHACYWNGNNTAIDGCGSSAGYVEGNCAQGSIPWFNKGSIMSYCHLVNGVGINFANGFGPQPAARILNHVESSGCLSTDCISTCINTIESVSIDSGANSTTISWIDNSSAGPWEVSIIPYPQGGANWQTVTTNSYTTNILNPNSYYSFVVRPACVQANAPQTQFIFGTGASFCSGLPLTDTGGINGNYGDNQYMVRVLKPDVPGAKIKVDFTSFMVELNYDFMYVFDGSDTDAPSLGEYTGSWLPGPFESTAEDGALTFVFVSDEGLNYSGWNATVTCSALGVDDVSFSDITYYPNPSGGIVNISSAKEIGEVRVYNVAGQLLLTQNSSTSTAAVDISSFADGVYFFKVVSGSKEMNFSIVKQN
jgi:hypothetical protein